MIYEIVCICLSGLAGLWLTLRHRETMASKATSDCLKRIEQVEQILARELAS